MSLFKYINRIDNILEFDLDQTHHMVKSFRKRIGDIIWATDGNGLICEARILSTSQNLTAEIISENNGANAQEIAVAISMIKKDSRFENFVEKATELGIQHIYPLRCQHSVKTKFRSERVEKIIVSAAQQSMNPNFPILHEPMDFDTFIREKSTLFVEKFFAYAPTRNNTMLLDQVYSGKPKVCVLIGPEGDFHKDEIELAKQYHWIPVSLGQLRLRTETAGMVTVQILKTIFNLKQ